MAWKKSSPDLMVRFHAALPDDPLIQSRKMFGYPASFVRGNFFAGLHQDNLVLRVPDELKQQLPQLEKARPFDPMGGRPMKGWYVAPPHFTTNAGGMKELLAAAFALAKNLPEKAPGHGKSQRKSKTTSRPAKIVRRSIKAVK